MNRRMGGAWLWGALVLAMAVGCSKDREPKKEAPAPKPAVVTAKRVQQALMPTCEANATQVDPVWRSGPLVVSGSQQKSFAASPGEQALVVIQNGDGKGQDEVQSGTVSLGGVSVGTIAAGTPLVVRRVTLAANNMVDVTTLGSGHLRVSVAATDSLPCVLASVSITQAGTTPSTEVRTFATPDDGALGVVLLDLYGLGASARVVYNGVTLVDGVPSQGPRGFAAVVALGATNTLEVTSQGNPGSVVRAVVFDVDTLPPDLTVAEPGDDAYLSNSPWLASGAVGPDATSVKVSGVAATVSGAGFTASVPLVEGSNNVTAVARDFCGNVVRICKPVMADTQAPLLEFGVPDKLSTANPVEVAWRASDAHLVSTEGNLNGTLVSAGTVVSANGDYVLEAGAVDQGDLESRRSIRFAIDTLAPSLSLSGVTDGLITTESVTPVFPTFVPGGVTVSATLDGSSFTSGTQVTAEGAHLVDVVMRNVQGHKAEQTAAFIIDRTPPWLGVSGVSDAGYYNAPVAVLFDATDDHLSDDPIQATLDDDPIYSGAVIATEGAHVLYAQVTDRAGNNTEQTLTVTVDFTPPVLSVTGVTADQTGTQNVTPSFSATDANLQGVNAMLNGVSFTSGTEVTAEGAYVLQVTATDLAGNKTISVVHFTIDRTAPVLQVSGVEEGGKYKTPVTASYSATDLRPVTLSATLDGQAFASGTQVSVEGDHTLVVTATDGAQNTATQTVHFLVDTMPPALTVESPANGFITQASTVTLVVTASDAHVLTGVTVDGVAMVLGAGEKYRSTLTLTEGSNSFEVVASDQTGNTTSTTVQVIKDATQPVITVAGVTEGQMSQQALTPSFSATDANLQGVSATLNGAPFTSGTQVSAEDEYALQVTATDLAGNEATSVVHFTIDHTAPVLQVSGVAEGGKYKTPVTVSYSATDLRPVTLSATLDGQAFATGTQVSVEGDHTLVVTATDGAQNTATQTVHFLVDTLPPALTVESPANGYVTQDSNVTLVVSASDAQALTDVKVGGASMTVGPDGKYRSSLQLTEGINTFEVVASDQADNTTSATLQVIKDTTSPVITVSGVTDNELTQQNVTPSLSVTDANLQEASATLNDASFTSGTVVSTEGTYVLQVTATDRAGNQATSVVHFTIDRTAPVLQISGVEEGGKYRTPVTVTYTALEIRPVTLSATLNGQSFASGTQVSDDGEYTLVVTATDEAQNTATQTVHFLVDTTPPTLTVESPANGFATQDSEVTLVVAASDAHTLSDVKVGGVSMVLGAGGKYRAPLQLVEGSNAFEVVAYDLAGNTTSATLQVFKDTTPPVLTVTGPADGALLTVSPVTVTGSVTDLTAITLKVGTTTVVPDEGGAFSAPRSLQPGTNTFQAVATDAAGNTSTVTRTVRYSATPPTLVIADPPDGYVFSEAFITVRGEVSLGDPTDTPQVTVDGAAVVVNAQGHFTTVVEIPVGEKTLLVRVQDSYGLSAQQSLTLRRLGEVGDGGTGGTASDGGLPPSSDAGTSVPDAGTPAADAGTSEPAPAPTLVVEGPADGTVVGGMSFPVTGRVEGGELPLQVTVNGLSAGVSSRYFSTALALLEGPHTVSIQVRDALGRTASTERSIIVDRTPPVLQITAPSSNPAQVAESPYLLRGTVTDANLASLWVSGQPVAAMAGEFFLPVALQAGDNAFTVEAVDLAGNRRTLVQHLFISNVAPVVTITDPLPGSEAQTAVIPVRIQVTPGTGLEEVRIGTGPAVQVSEGVYTAEVPLSFGENTITATAKNSQGITGSASVTVRYRDASREPLAVTGVEPEPSAVGVETDALISVAFNKAVDPATAASHFEAWAQGQKLEGGYSVAPGGQTVTFVARRALPTGERIQVKVNGMEAQTGPDMEAPFASEFTVRRPLTVVRGVVMDEHLQPLSGVRVQVEGQEQSARTGADGNWALVGVQGGSQVALRYEGGTTADGRTLPTVRRKLFVSAEQETEDRPLVMVAVNGASAQQVDGDSGAEVTFGGAHGPMKLTVPAGGLMFADGSTSGFLTATEIQPFLRPVPIEDRASATALWQLGPERARFLKSVDLTLPNRTALDAGRMVVLLGFDESRLAMRRVGFGHVSQDKTAIVSDEPVSTTSLEFFGYMEITPEQQAKVEEVLAQGGVTSGQDAGTTGGDDGGFTDGGLGLRLDAPVRNPPSMWERLQDLVIGQAYALTLNEVLTAFTEIDEFPGGIAHLKGVVRAPREDETQLTLMVPESGSLSQTTEVQLPYTQHIEFKARYDSNQPIPPSGDDAVTVTATLSAKGPNGSDLAPGAGEQWLVQGANEATLVTEVDLPLGTTMLSLAGQTRFDTRAIRLRAELEPIVPDSGVPTRAKLTVIKESDSSEGEEDPLHGAARFTGVTVNVTSSNDSAAVSGVGGKYAALVLVPAPDTMGIACAQIPIGPRFVPRLDEEGNTRFDSVRGAFSTCSQSFWMYPDQTTQADVVVDVRMLLGNVTFKHKDGTKLPVVCKDATQTVPNEETGELDSISAQDVATTEVHFFREDNLEQPIASYAVTQPLEETCADPANPPTGPQGMYSRMRLGPANAAARATRERCQWIAAEGPQTPEDEAFYKAECGSGSSGFLQLSAGDRVVVFAVNHATGYAGMKTVTVPSINRNARAADGTCPADANGLLEIDEGGQKIYISHCTQQELGIPADVDLYPPEIDVRVQRRAQDEGLAQIAKKHLIRTGGSGTTRDDYLQVVTHWRVRKAPVSVADGGVPAPEGGTGGGSEEDCDKGLRPDGGSCSPGAITDDDGQDGKVLEVYCSELPPGATAQQWASCLHDDQQLGDVPKGVPPLAGQIIRVTGSAVEQPAVTTFPVAPGQNTVNVQASLRRINGNGQRETINNLVSANYYLHVVGNRLLERDLDGDGYVSPSEDEAKPPHFEEPSERDGGYPAGLPAQALYLKNVFKRYGSDGALMEQYDLAREHEFRILQLEPQKVVARGDDAPRDMREDEEPGAKERDLSYEFLASLLAPEPGRAGTLSGDYRVRLGSDQFGIDCPFKVDELTHSITATCGGEYIGEVLSASDILYLELYLSGNAENVLYRFNFYGLASRRDELTASMEYTAEVAVAADDPDGTPKPGRPVSRPAMTNFFVEPAQLTSGVVKVCLNQTCQPQDQNLLKEVKLNLRPEGGYAVEELGGIVKEKLLQSKTSTPTGARRFKMQLPAHLASMPGSGNTSVPVFLVLEPLAPTSERLVMALGKPEGSYNGANARAVGQEVVAGVNVTDGHLGFEHVDFAVPFLNGSFAFKRIYNNQNNQPTHLGLGWTHNFDGWVLEEKVGRYIVVIGGQGFAFPQCEKDAEHEGNAACTQPGMTDKTHAFTLTVDAPLELPDSAQPDDKVVLKTPDGWTFEFNRPVKGPREEGQRKWMLTRFGDKHARQDSNVGWTKLKYEGDTDRLSEVIQLADVGSMGLLFTYEDVNTADAEVPDYIRLLARSKDFKWMKAVLFTSETLGNYSVTFERDHTGNLRRAVREQGTPFQIYEYDYWPPALSMGPTERWEAINELAVARTIYGATREAHEPVQWRASYWRSSESAPYRHVKAHEMVSAVSATGMQGERLEIRYTAANKRVLTRPDGVQLTLTLNQSGNVGNKLTPAGAEDTFWGSDSRGGDVVPSTQVSPTGRELQMSHGPSLLLSKVELTQVPEGSRPVAGLGSGGTLVDYTLDDRFGLPSETRLKVGTGTATVSSPHSDTGDLTSLAATSGQETRSLLQNALYDDDGLLLSYTDAQGRDVQFQDFNALGQPQTMILTLQSAASGGLEAITRHRTYDPYGRLTGWEDEQTQGFESFSFDALGRTLTHTVSGTPEQVWTYTYEDQENALTVTEKLKKNTAGTTADHERTLYFVDGRLEGESFLVGDRDQPVSRSYEYEHGRLARVIDEENTPHVYHYDPAGRLQQVTTASGLSEVEYTLNAEGKPYYVIDDLGHRTTIAYDGLGRPVFWDWGDGDTEEVQLDAQGVPVRRLLDGTSQHAVSMTSFDPLGNPQSTDSESSTGGVHEERRYDDAGRLTRQEDEELGLVDTYEYKDVLGRPTKHSRTVQTPAGELTLEETRTYDDAEHTMVVLRSIGTGEGSRTETEKYTLDTAGRVLKMERTVGGQPAVDEYQYTERGQVWWHKSPTNAITQSLYDPLGNLMRVVDAESYTTTYELDVKGRVHLEHGPDPRYQCTYEYDDLGRLESKTVAPVGTTPETSWTYAYDPSTHEVKETVDLGGEKTIVTTRRSNARGLLVREVVSGESGSREMTADFQGPWEKSRTVREGSGWEAKTEYHSRDDRGRALEEEEKWSAGVLSYNYTTTTIWSGRNATVGSVDDAGGRHDERTAQLTVDSLGNVVELTRDGQTDRWVYDAAGVLVKKTPAGTPATQYTYTEGLLTGDSFGGEPTLYTYYPDGRLKSRKTPDLREMQYDYWPRGSVKQSRYGKQGDFQTTGFTYDANGALLSVTYGEGSPDAQQWQYTRGARGELLTVAQPGAGVFTYNYDGLLRLTKVTPPGNGTAEETFDYDYLGRPTRRTRGGALWQTTWNSGGATQVDPNQDKTEMLLDGRGRVARVNYLPSSASASNTDLTGVTYAYTAADQPWKVVEGRASAPVENFFTYDARRLLTQATRGSDSVGFTYTPSGQRLTMTSPAGTLTYGYDELDRLKTITGSGLSDVTTLEWEPGGERLTGVKGGALGERRCYDARGQVSAVLNAGVNLVSCDNLDTASGLHSRFDYTYDGRGNRLKEVYRDAQLPMAEETRYGYDAADRLTGVLYPNGVALLYQLTGDGTRKAEKEVAAYSGPLGPDGFASAVAQRHWVYGLDNYGGLEGIYDANQANQRLATYVTDPAGRLRSKVTPSDQKQYGWDAAGRLTRLTVQPASQGSTITATYDYGWDGLRVSRTVGSQTTGYLWAGDALVEERLPGQPALLYAQAAGLTLSVGTDRIAHDGLGSAVGRVGATDTWHRYDAWGGYQTGNTHWTVPSSAQASLGYTGHAYDADTGLTYAQQRWYDSSVGRFLSEDPVGAVAYLGTPQGLNPWLYANGNPTRYTDPDGRIANVAIGAGIGAAIGCGVGWWNANQGEGWSACGKGALIGGAAGALAGATFGASLAVTGTATGSAILGTTGGSTLISGTLAGAVGGAVGSGGSVLIEGGTFQDARRVASIGALTGAVGGVVGSVAGNVIGGVVGRQTGNRILAGAAEGFVDGVIGDATAQGIMIAGGAQDEFSFTQLGVGGLLGAGIGGVVGRQVAPDLAEDAIVDLESSLASEGVEYGPVAASPAIASRRTDLELSQAAERVSARKGRFDLIVHADEKNLYVKTGPGKKDWAKLSPERAARLSRALGHKGEPIRLIACESGRCATGAAQQFADAIGVPVLAPTERVWIHPDGRLTLGPTEYSRKGQWKWFAPRKRF